jgi:hypothetical protein
MRMTNMEREDGTTREDLVQRVALMEEMIAEGRKSTVRFGWVFLLWGLIDLAGVGWDQIQPDFRWVWPITISAGFVLQFIILALRRKRGQRCGGSMRGRSVAAVWRMMGLTVLLYVVAAIVQHKAGQISYIAAILMFVGMAHAISALILRWLAQGIVAGVWLAGGIATFFVPRSYVLGVFIAEMCFGMILFGLYAMWLEHRAAALEQHHA